jgi:hypothetical protein
MRAKAATRKKAVRKPDPILGATRERLERAREAGQQAIRDDARLQRIVDPFDMLRANRALAPQDARLNAIRWLVGEALRHLHQRAQLDQLRAVAPDRIGATAFGPRSGLPAAESALRARDLMHRAAGQAGAAAWPIVTRIVIEGGAVKDCRPMIAEVTTEWRADAIIMDRLRCALDALGGLVGVTGGGASHRAAQGGG